MVTPSLIKKCTTAPTPWQDPVLTPASINAMLASNNTHLWSHQTTPSKSDGHIALRSDGLEAEILTLWVHPPHRRHGIARALLATTISYAMQQALTKLHLEVRPTNTPAIKLYKKFGFTHTATRPNYYQSPTEDALILTLNL